MYNKTNPTITTMWSTLSEYCLSHIFSFLQPHDWIHVSEVCQFWRQVASRKWKKITEINNLEDFFEHDEYKKKATVISVKVAKKMFINAAPYIKVLKAGIMKHRHLLFGSFCYKIKQSFDTDTILKVLILARATEVINASFCLLPNIELMKQFLLTNNVKVLSYFYSEEHHHQLPAQGVEELTVIFTRNYSGHPATLRVKSFAGHFPNVKSLALEFYFKSGDNINEMVSRVLPYFRGITCLKLGCYFVDFFVIPHEILNRVLLHSELEELSIKLRLDRPTDDTPDTFLTFLRTRCPKIRILNIDFSQDFKAFGFLSVMSLPKLERLTIGDLSFDLSPMEYPEMKNLTELQIALPDNDPSLEGIFGAMTKMPKLKTIVLKFRDRGEFEYFSKHHQVQLIRNVAFAASSQGKDLLVTNLLSGEKSRKLEIKKNVDLQALELVDNECETLHLASEFLNEEESFEDARQFLRRELDGYHVSIS